MTRSNTSEIDVVVDHTESKFGVIECVVELVMILITLGDIGLDEVNIIIKGRTSVLYKAT